MKQSQFKRIAAFAAVYLLWGGSYVAIRQVVHVMPPMMAAAIRYASGGAILLVISFGLKRETLPAFRPLRNSILSGAVMIVAGYAIVFWAATQLPSWTIAVLISTSFLWTYLGECFVLRSQKFRPAALVAVITGLAGIALISRVSIVHGRPGSLIAVIGIQACTVAWSASTLALKKIQLPECPFQTAGLQLTSAGLLLALISFSIMEWKNLQSPFPFFTPGFLGSMAYLVIGGSVVAFGAFHWLMQRESPSLVGAFAYLNPIVALILGIEVVHEPWSLAQIAGAALVLFSVVLVWEVKEPRITIRIGAAARFVSSISEPSLRAR